MRDVQSTVSQNSSGFPIQVFFILSPKTRSGKYQKQFDKTGRPKRPADLW
jgi:hypothetical protein